MYHNQDDERVRELMPLPDTPEQTFAKALGTALNLAHAQRLSKVKVSQIAESVFLKHNYRAMIMKEKE